MQILEATLQLLAMRLNPIELSFGSKEENHILIATIEQELETLKK